MISSLPSSGHPSLLECAGRWLDVHSSTSLAVLKRMASSIVLPPGKMLHFALSVGIVRRTAASALMFFVLAPLFVWLAVPEPQSTLPACCRRDGKHHCAAMAMMEEREQDPTPSIRDSSSTCPYHSACAAVSAASVAGPPARFAFFAQTVSRPEQIVQIVIQARISEARSHLKRGPPRGILPS